MSLSTVHEMNYDKWQQPQPYDARRLIAQICRKSIHPALSGYFFRKYVMMQTVAKHGKQYAAINWGEYKALCESKAGPNDSGKFILQGTFGADKILPVIQDWWELIYAPVSKVVEFMNDLILLFADDRQKYDTYRAIWDRVANTEFEVLQTDGDYLPDDKHALFIEATFGTSSEILSAMKGGLAEFSVIQRRPNQLQVAVLSEVADFTDPMIFMPLLNPIQTEGGLHVITQGYMPALEKWYAVTPEDDGGIEIASLFEHRWLSILCEDFCQRITSVFFDLKNCEHKIQFDIAERLEARAKGMEFAYVAGTNPEHRHYTAWTWKECQNFIKGAEEAVSRGITKVPQIPTPGGPAAAPISEGSPSVSGPMPAQRRKRVPEKSVTFEEKAHPKDEKKEEYTWIWALGAIGAAFLILRR